MLLHCPGKKCNTTRDHKLKVDTAEVICMDCEEVNNVVSDYMKIAMKASGDVYRTVTKKKAFTYKCPRCTVDRGVKIIDEQAVCEACQQPLNLSAPMLQAIKQMGGESKAAPLATEATAPKAELSKGSIKRKKQ